MEDQHSLPVPLSQSPDIPPPPPPPPRSGRQLTGERSSLDGRVLGERGRPARAGRSRRQLVVAERDARRLPHPAGALQTVLVWNGADALSAVQKGMR